MADNYDFSGLDDVDKKYDFSGLDEQQPTEDQEGILRTLKDAAMAGGQGLTMGFGDELLGGAQAISEAPSSWDDFVSRYRKHQQENQADYEAARERSPVLTTVGEIGGAILPLAATGGTAAIGEAAGAGLGKLAMTGAKQAAPLAALTAAGSSHGTLDDAEGVKTLAQDTAVGGILGGALGGTGSVVGKGLGKAGEYLGEKAGAIIEDNPYLRQIGKAFKEEYEGRTSFIGDKAGEALDINRKTAAMKHADELLKGRDVLGVDIESVLNKADQSGIKIGSGDAVSNYMKFGQTNNSPMIDLGDDLRGAIKSLREAFDEKKSTFRSSDSNSLLNSLNRLEKEGLSPSQANNLKKSVKEIFFNTNNDDLRSVAGNFSTAIDDVLKNNIEGYRNSMNRYSGYLRAGPETILNNGKPIELNSGKYISDLSNVRDALSNKFEDILKYGKRAGTIGDEAIAGHNAAIRNLSELDKHNPGFLNKLGLDINSFDKELKDNADIFSIASTVRGHEPHSSSHSPKQLLTTGGGGATSRGMVYGGAGLIGKVAKVPEKISKFIYNLPDEGINKLSQFFRGKPGTLHLADSLDEAIRTGNKYKKNATLFSIMQDPNLRRHIQEFSGIQIADEPKSETGDYGR